MPCVTLGCGKLKNPHCSMTISVEDREADDVSKWVKYYRVGRKTPNKQTNITVLVLSRGWS